MLPSMLAPDTLRLDALHRYWLGDRELVSVTTALKEAHLLDNRWFTEDAAARGTYVHQACELVDARDLGDVDPLCAGYVEAYRRFLAEARPLWSHSEHRVFDATVGYAGTLDRAGELNGQWIVLDIKTGPPAPWHALQLAAYGRLMPPRPKRFDLYLTDTGSYRLVPQVGHADDAMFLAALAVANFRRLHGYGTR